MTKQRRSSAEIAAFLRAAGAEHFAKNPRPKDAAARQADFRQRMEEEGFVQVTGWVRRDQAAAVSALIRRLRDDPALEPGPVRNTRTGRIERI